MEKFQSLQHCLLDRAKGKPALVSARGRAKHLVDIVKAGATTRRFLAI